MNDIEDRIETARAHVRMMGYVDTGIAARAPVLRELHRRRLLVERWYRADAVDTVYVPRRGGYELPTTAIPARWPTFAQRADFVIVGDNKNERTIFAEAEGDRFQWAIVDTPKQGGTTMETEQARAGAYRRLATTSWYVGFEGKDWPFLCQLTAPTQDGKPNEDAQLQCGPTCCSMVGMLYRGIYVAPDTIKDYILGQNKTGITYDNNQIQALDHFFSIPSTSLYPTRQNGNPGGLLYFEWQMLYYKRPVLGSFSWVSPDGTVYDDINHWRVAYGMDSTYVYSADPWTGQPIIETYDQHWARSKRVLVAVLENHVA